MMLKRWYFFVFILIGCLILLQSKLWSPAGSIKEYQSLKNLLARQIAENQQLQRDNEALIGEIRQLRHSKELTEMRARQELGMIKKGEKFYQIVK